MSKHWDYEDDHDWDDDYDYAANDYVYWYGKYYPKEEIDALFKDSLNDDTAEDSSSSALGWIFLAIAGIGAVGYGIHKKVIPTIRHKREKNDEETKRNKNKSVNGSEHIMFENRNV